MKTISCGIAAGLVELCENIMEESSFAQELEVCTLISGCQAASISFPAVTEHKPWGCLVAPVGTQWSGDCRGPFCEFFAAVLHHFPHSWIAFHQFSKVSDCAKLPWLSCSARGLSVCSSPQFGRRCWKILIVQGSRSEIETNLGNELRHPCWMSGHPHSSGTVGRQHQGNYCTYCMQGGDSFVGLYLLDFPLKIVKVWAKNVTLWVTAYLRQLRFQEERLFHCCFQ